MTTDIMQRVELTEYYADLLTPQETLSQSTAHVLVTRSPKHAWAQHPRLGGRPRKVSDEMELGTIIDEMLIGGGRRLQKVMFDDYRSNAAKSAKAAAEAAGYVPVKQSKYDDLVAMADRIKKSLEIGGVELEGENVARQVCVLWEEKATNGATVQCKGLLDAFDYGALTIYDLKTTANAHPRKLPAKCLDFGYQIQAAAYISAIEHVMPDAAGRVKFRNAFVETEWPYVTLVTEPDGEALHWGRVMWQRAVDVWEECLRTAKWPGYAARGEVVRVGLPSWADEMLCLDEEESDAA